MSFALLMDLGSVSTDPWSIASAIGITVMDLGSVSTDPERTGLSRINATEKIWTL